MYITQPLHPSHNRNDFSSGKDLLDNYLKTQVNQDIKRKLTACFVLNEGEVIQGYYTLSSNSIPLSSLPEPLQKKLPRSYQNIPVTLLGRLAIDAKQQGKGIGKLLLADALKRSFEASHSIGSFALVADPLDTDAETFYLKFGFIKLPDSGKMFLAMKTIEQLFES